MSVVTRLWDGPSHQKSDERRQTMTNAQWTRVTVSVLRMMRLDAMSDVPCPISLMPMRVRCDELACLFSQAMPMAKSKNPDKVQEPFDPYKVLGIQEGATE